MIKNNKAILEEANAAISKGDYEGFLKFCTSDTTWTFVGDRILKGKEAVREWMLKEYIEPPKFKVKHLIAENDFVTALGNITMKDENGKTIQYSYCDVWQFHDGKMHELTAFVIDNTGVKK
ncbi:MAG: nuclear transport factor 2 family protein [Flavobacteriales bacterium]